MRGLFIGRFQPLHNGHLKAIEYALKKVDELIIGVGSAQYSYSIENPFTAGERILMIRDTLKEAGIDLSRVYIIPIVDVHNNNIWVAHVESLVPKFDIVFSNNPLVTELFTSRGYKVEQVPMYKREILSSTHIRKLMLKGDPEWRKLVPKAVAKVIDSVRGEERLRKVSSSDEKQRIFVRMYC